MSIAIGLTEEEYSFIEDKFGIKKESIDGYSEDELCDLQDICSDIEIEAATDAGDGNLSADGETASSIVTKIGIALCGDDEDE